MKTTFLAVIFTVGIIFGRNNHAPYIGKWHNTSSTSSIKEIVFFPDKNVKFSNCTSSMLQRYSLLSSEENKNKFTGFFEIINAGKIAKKSPVGLMFLENDIIELQIDGKKLLLKKH